MCEEHPRHIQVGTVAGKVWLIGRSYAAAVERRTVPAGASHVSIEGFYKDQVAPALISSDIDQKLDLVRQHTELSGESLLAVLDAHHHLVTVLRRFTHQDKRSLASKYLHFHAPMQVPIYDSVAATVMSRLMPRCRVRRATHSGFDATYTRFAFLLLDLRDSVERDYGVRLSTRELDRLLLQSESEAAV